MHETTVVGWDGSDTAETALEWAIARAEMQPEGMRLLRMVRAVDDSGIAGDDEETRELLARAEREIAERADRVRAEHPSLEVEASAVRGEPGDMLADRSGDDSLVVVGAENGRTDEYWHSSRLGPRLAGAAGGPVAVIPIGDVLPRAGVMVAVDHGAPAERLCRLAADYAAKRGETLHAVHVGARSHDVAEDAEILDRALEPALAGHPDLPVERHVDSGPTAPTLLRRAREHATVFVGSRQIGTVRRMFLGSVSHALVTNARCATVVVPPVSGLHSEPDDTAHA
ncbi:universal stress protein [Agromyces sp. ZXT2-6]|uniref:universal stress protein n=1 Tax=Agromyces sp. ZXT2-6 TaxID=3461153 RepID=UPI0040552557